MELEQIFALIDRFDSSSMTGLELELGGMCLKLEKAQSTAAGVAIAPALAASAPAAAAKAPVSAPIQADSAYIKSPLVGTFYAAAAPDKPAFAPVGTTVKKGQTVCVLEAMKMMSEIPAPFDCVIEEILCADGALAGFDAPLFRVRAL